MKARMLISMAGPNGALAPGDEAPEGEAENLVAAGFAEEITQKRESATKKKRMERRDS